MAEPNSKRQKLDLSDTFIVLVGATKKAYTFHRGIAIQTSGYFERATKGEWREAKDKKVILSHVEPRLFDIYSHWLYKNEILMEATSTSQGGFFADHMELYLLGQYLLDTAFQNAIIDETLSTMDTVPCVPGRQSIDRIWADSPDGCTVKRLLLRSWCKLGEESMKKNAAGANADFLVQLLAEMVRMRDARHDGNVPTWKKRCDYHEHNDKTPKRPGCTAPSTVKQSSGKASPAAKK